MPNLNPDVIGPETSRLILETYLDKTLINATKKLTVKGVEYSVRSKNSINKILLSKYQNSWFANTFSPTLANEADMREGDRSYVLSIWDVFKNYNIDNDSIKQKEYILSIGGYINEVKTNNKSLIRTDLSSVSREHLMYSSINKINTLMRVIDYILKDDLDFIQNCKSIIYSNILEGNQYLTHSVGINTTFHNLSERLKNYQGHNNFFYFHSLRKSGKENDVSSQYYNTFLDLDHKLEGYLLTTTKEQFFSEYYNELLRIKNELEKKVFFIKSSIEESPHGNYIDRLFTDIQKEFQLENCLLMETINQLSSLPQTPKKSELISKVLELDQVFNLKDVFIKNKYTIIKANFDIKYDLIELFEKKISDIQDKIDLVKEDIEYINNIIDKDVQKKYFLKKYNPIFNFLDIDISYNYLMKKNNLSSHNLPQDIKQNIIEEVFNEKGQKIRINTLYVPYYNMRGEEQCFQKIRPNKGYYWDSSLTNLVEDKQVTGSSTGVFRVVSNLGSPLKLFEYIESEANQNRKVPIILTEGLATGHSFANINIPTLVCLNASNIRTVIERFSEKYNNIEFIIAGEKDKYISTKINGVEITNNYGTNEKMSISALENIKDNNFIYILSNLLHRDSLEDFTAKKNKFKQDFKEGMSIPDGTDFNDAQKKYGAFTMLQDFSQSILKKGVTERSYALQKDSRDNVYHFPPLSKESIEKIKSIIPSYINSIDRNTLIREVDRYITNMIQSKELDIIKYLLTEPKHIATFNLNHDNYNNNKVFKLMCYYEAKDYEVDIQSEINNIFDFIGASDSERNRLITDLKLGNVQSFSHEDIYNELTNPRIQITKHELEMISDKITIDFKNLDSVEKEILDMNKIETEKAKLIKEVLISLIPFYSNEIER